MKLNELEGLTMGLVKRHGPCTAYAVRQKLKSSPSSHWRGSAGSVYPLLDRLEGEGLIRGEDDESDGRGRRLLSVTATGSRALKAWLKRGAEAAVTEQVFDPLRTRIFFLDTLPSGDRLKLAEDMLAGNKQFLAEIDADKRGANPDLPLETRLGAQGARMAQAARVEFLELVVKQLKKET